MNAPPGHAPRPPRHMIRAYSAGNSVYMGTKSPSDINSAVMYRATACSSDNSRPSSSGSMTRRYSRPLTHGSIR